jgi:hypothetical protein
LYADDFIVVQAVPQQEALLSFVILCLNALA